MFKTHKAQIIYTIIISAVFISLFVILFSFRSSSYNSYLAATESAQHSYIKITKEKITTELTALGFEPTLTNSLTINCKSPKSPTDSTRRGYKKYDAATQCSSELIINAHHKRKLDYKQIKQKLLANGWQLNAETDYTKTQNSWGATSDYSKNEFIANLTETDGPNTAVISIKRRSVQ